MTALGPEFPFNWVPLREGTTQRLLRRLGHRKFPFNWVPLREGTCYLLGVNPCLKRKFPFNWVPLREGTVEALLPFVGSVESFHSIGFPCERGLPKSKLPFKLSTGFPFNWVPLREGTFFTKVGKVFIGIQHVSIQLGSPARGDIGGVSTIGAIAEMFPFNWVPLREGTRNQHLD